MPNRRTLLLTLGGLTAQVALGIALLPALETYATTAPPERDRNSTTFRYRNRRVKISETGDLLMASVDGRMIHVDRSSQRRYHSHLRPFQDYPDMRSLMADLIDMDADHLVIL